MTTTKPKILVVATHNDCELLSQTIGNGKYEIFLFEHPADAVCQIRDPVDLVLCDVGDGCQQLMRQWHERRPTTPFILLANPNQIVCAINAMKHGAVDYIAKPINGEELVVRIAKWLEASRKNERLQQLESRFEVGKSEARHNGYHNGNGNGIDIPAGVSLDDLERAAVEKALAQYHGNRTHAARSLGISVRTLQRKLKAWHVPMFAMQHHSSLSDFSMPYAR